MRTAFSDYPDVYRFVMMKALCFWLTGVSQFIDVAGTVLRSGDRAVNTLDTSGVFTELVVFQMER